MDFKLKKSMATLSILGVNCPPKPPSHELTPPLSNSVASLSMALHFAAFFHLWVYRYPGLWPVTLISLPLCPSSHLSMTEAYQLDLTPSKEPAERMYLVSAQQRLGLP